MSEGHDAAIEVCNIMSFVLYTQILKQSVLKPASPGITLNTYKTMQIYPVLSAQFKYRIAAMTKLGKMHCFVGI